MLFIPMQDNQNEVLVAGGAAYMPKPNTDVIKARQDAVRLGGGYDYGTGLYNRNLVGTTAGDLDQNMENNAKQKIGLRQDY